MRNESNLHIGNTTEKNIGGIFRSHGYWVYNCPRSSAGSQPVDFIAIKRVMGKGKSEDLPHYIVWLVDGKHVASSRPSFTFERVEDNQLVSMMYARDFANILVENLGFVIEFDRTNTFYWLSLDKYLEMSSLGHKSANLSELELFEKELSKYDD